MTLGLPVAFGTTPPHSRTEGDEEKPVPDPVPYDSRYYESEAHYLAYLAGTASLNGRLPRLDYLRSQGVEIPDIMQFVPW